MAYFKLICLILFTIGAIAIMIIPKVISEQKYKNEKQRIRKVVKIRMGIFLAMMGLLLICVLF
jgi:amino acid permease